MKLGRQVAAMILLQQISCMTLVTNYQVRATCDGGLASGTYELLLPDGTIQIAGEFSNGRRHGIFTFYRSTGEKVAEIPYDQNRISGIVRLWYGPEHGSGRRKLVSRYVDDRLEGDTEGWFEDGSGREISSYANGTLMTTNVRGPRGRELSESAARQQQAFARESDRTYFSILAEIVQENPADCPILGAARAKR